MRRRFAADAEDILPHVTLARLGLTAAVAAAGLGLLIHSSSAPVQHYGMVDELICDGLDAWRGADLKVHGWVRAGSIVRAIVEHEDHQTFVIQRNGQQLRVFSRGALPDVFKDGAEIVVAGQLADPEPFQALAHTMCREGGAGRTGCPVDAGAEQAWVIEATAVSAKCAVNYHAATADQRSPGPEFK